MNVFYEEDGSFKVAAILADNGASLQVESPHGKRSKIKLSHVLFRFDGAIAHFMEEAQQAADALDVAFLWECCGDAEFSYESLGREYFGHAPSPQESAALLLRLHGSPMYFYRKGKGHYKPAPAEALKAALASIERKQQQAALQARYLEQLSRFEFPEEFRTHLPELLYRPDRNSVEVKALEQAASEAGMSTAHLLSRCGAIGAPHDYHLNRFLFDYFPAGRDPLVQQATVIPDLPRAPVAAFSIDDATTTEIDDAFSVRRLPDGGWEIGVHIAAPALGIAPGSALDDEAASRMSTVYMPGAKITMLPEAVIEQYTLAEGRSAPAVSLYLDLASDLRVRSTRSAVERVPIVANLRHEALEAKNPLAPTCASCHRTIDPPGFALESFDVIGGWRDEYRSVGKGTPAVVDGRTMRYKKGPTVDPSGQMPDGSKFKDIDEFKALLLRDKKQLARAMAGKLLAYATGATPGRGERAEIEKLVERVAEKGYGFRTLVHEVVQSGVFKGR